MTDDDGAFSLQNDKGLTRLVVSSLGYDNKVVNLKAGQKNNALNVLLRPTSFEIAEVVVSLNVRNIPARTIPPWN